MLVNDAAKGRRTVVALAVACALCQLMVAPNIGILGGRANFALVFVGCATIATGSASAPALGFAAGLFYDLAGTGPVGLMALALTLAAFALSRMGSVGAADDPVGALGAFVPVDLAVAVLYALVLLASGQASSFVDVVLMRALPGALLDGLFFLAACALMGRSGRGSGGLGAGSRRGGHYSVKGL